MSGVGQIPRIASIPGRGDAGSYGYPSAVSRFTNLAYVGGSFENLFESENFKWKIKPNILEYWQPAVPRVYDPVLAERLGFQVGQAISSHLGSELNIFLEAQPLHVEGIQFFATATCFLPGAYYKDISGIPLDKRQEAYLDRVNANGVVDEFVPTTGSNAAFYIMAGLEYRF